MILDMLLHHCHQHVKLANIIVNWDLCPQLTWTAAPRATASSGSTPDCSGGSGFQPVMLVMKRCTAGMRVAPPTSNTLLKGARALGRISSISCSNKHSPTNNIAFVSGPVDEQCKGWLLQHCCFVHKSCAQEASHMHSSMADWPQQAYRESGKECHCSISHSAQYQ
eukprot:GHRR01018593.1.p2 GENE.GHRR01018593.1~~GHRR01018593.1.p2  ORF type:complete len:166 (-),score=36.56 GHRR01018593.1:1538-2035(-)